MPRRHKSNGRPIHTNVLRVSRPDDVTLGQAVHERFVEVLDLYLRSKDEKLVPPKMYDKDMILWRTMVMRHREGDYRNTDDELKATKRVADWTYQRKCELVGKEYTPIEWGD